MARATKKDYTFAVGRRKTSVARVRLFPGRGDTLVNNLPIATYFASVALAGIWAKPLQITKTDGKFWATIKVAGGGKKSQLDAAILGISRALVTIDADNFRSPLKKQGLLSRDARQRERRKVGTGGKSRRKKQSPKR